MFKSLCVLLFMAPQLVFAGTAQQTLVSSVAQSTAAYALDTYQQSMIDSLAKLVSYNTVAVEGMPSPDNPVHQAFKQELSRQAAELGLDFRDFGYVVVIGLGESNERLGVITHGDVQPVDPSKWAKSPFELDSSSEPGLLLARGAEDDKGPIATALYAMKAIKDRKIKLQKRIELYVYMAEESDWGPLQAFVKQHEMPQLNITIDANYPVVTAEKGYGTIKMTFPDKPLNTSQPYISRFSGGFFASQIPEDAEVEIQHVSDALVRQIRISAAQQHGMTYTFTRRHDMLTIHGRGKSSHSSEPQNGVNAITHLAAVLADHFWPANAAGALVNFINQHMGTGIYGERFGNIAYSDDFMGPMTVAPTVLIQHEDGIGLSINLRRPVGKSSAQLNTEINDVLSQWQLQNKLTLSDIAITLSEPFVQTDAPQVATLLSVFSHYTGIKEAKPVAIGGGTNSRLFPTAVSFGPSMPGIAYTGHSEHEFISVEQIVLNLQMYTAALVELATQ